MVFASTKNIDNKITKNKNESLKKESQKKKTNSKIKTLVKTIKIQEKEYRDINIKLDNLNNTIFLNRIKLSKVKEDIAKLKKQTLEIQEETKRTQEKIIYEITNKYSASIGVSLAKKPTTKEIIDKEIYTLLLEESSDNILKLNLEYLKSTMKTRKNQATTIKLAKYIEHQEKEKIKYNKLKKKQKIIISKLSKQHKRYQKRLKDIISKQYNLQDLLAKLNILKKKEIKRDKLRRAKLKKQNARKAKAKSSRQQSSYRDKSRQRQLDDEIDIEVRNIGSSTRGIKISRYKGRKTIAPLRSYKVVKKFGKYYDPVYKIKLFNEALSMRPNKRNSKVYNVLQGKIVYAKKNSGTLENVVIVQHKGGLHTIYSHLDKIAPTLRIGKWIKKGFVVGRVSNTLMFQVTKNSRYINPQELFK